MPDDAPVTMTTFFMIVFIYFSFFYHLDNYCHTVYNRRCDNYCQGDKARICQAVLNCCATSFPLFLSRFHDILIQRRFFEPGFCVAQASSRFLSPINRALMEYENVSFWREKCQDSVYDANQRRESSYRRS